MNPLHKDTVLLSVRTGIEGINQRFRKQIVYKIIGLINMKLVSVLTSPLFLAVSLFGFAGTSLATEVTLQGVVNSTTPMALIAVDKQKAKYYRVGDPLSDELSVSTILIDRINVKSAQGVVEVLLQQKIDLDGSTFTSGQRNAIWSAGAPSAAVGGVGLSASDSSLPTGQLMQPVARPDIDTTGLTEREMPSLKLTPESERPKSLNKPAEAGRPMNVTDAEKARAETDNDNNNNNR